MRYCCLLLQTIANSLEPDQDRQFDTHIAFLKEFLKKLILKKSQQMTKQEGQVALKLSPEFHFKITYRYL